MRQIICDRCGKEITGPKIGYVAINWKDVSTDDLLELNPYEHADFCDDCMEAIWKFIDNKVEEPAADPEPVSKPESNDTEMKSARKRWSPSDFGKMLALKRAGWTIKRIADEFHIGEKNCWYLVNKAEGLLEEGKIVLEDVKKRGNNPLELPNMYDSAVMEELKEEDE